MHNKFLENNRKTKTVIFEKTNLFDQCNFIKRKHVLPFIYAILENNRKRVSNQQEIYHAKDNKVNRMFT